MPTLNEALGLNVLKYRKLKDLSQEQLAKAIGVERQTITRYESGKGGASLDTISRLALALDVNETDLVSTVQELKTLRVVETAEEIAERVRKSLAVYEILSPEIIDVIIKLKKAEKELLPKLIKNFASLGYEDQLGLYEMSVDDEDVSLSGFKKDESTG